MSPRDELIGLLTQADMRRDEWERSTYEAQADALLAAGWRAPKKPPEPKPGLTYDQALERAHRLSGW